MDSYREGHWKGWDPRKGCCTEVEVTGGDDITIEEGGSKTSGMN